MEDRVGVLERAIAEIEKGWCQREREDEDGNVCAIGALERATSGSVGDVDALPYELGDLYGLNRLVREKFHNFPDRAVYGGEYGIQDVNDQLGKDAVLSLFKEQLRREKAKAGVLLEVPANCSETQRVYANV